MSSPSRTEIGTNYGIGRRVFERHAEDELHGARISVRPNPLTVIRRCSLAAYLAGDGKPHSVRMISFILSETAAIFS